MKIKKGNLNYDQSGRAYPDEPQIKENWECIWEFEGKHYELVGDDEHKEWGVCKIEMNNMKYNIYLDDVRTPIANDRIWEVVRSYDEFVDKVTELGLENIELISLDHDLGDTAMDEWYNNVSVNFTLNYDNIKEKTGMDCVKWLIEKWMGGSPVCKVMVHSANAIGASNMMGYINNYRHINNLPQDCIRWIVPHIMETQIN